MEEIPKLSKYTRKVCGAWRPWRTKEEKDRERRDEDKQEGERRDGDQNELTKLMGLEIEESRRFAATSPLSRKNRWRKCSNKTITASEYGETSPQRNQNATGCSPCRTDYSSGFAQATSKGHEHIGRLALVIPKCLTRTVVFQTHKELYHPGRDAMARTLKKQSLLEGNGQDASYMGKKLPNMQPEEI